MTPRQFILPIAHEMTVDLFAGGGGASTGIEQATGRHVDIAVNHDPQAVSLHEANHPQTRHFVSDVFEVDPLTVTNGRPVGLLWASPDCKHFSKAKGAQPRSKKVRALANVIVDWAAAVRPRVICMENVEEFKTWGELDEAGRPIPELAGELFKEWRGKLEALGYVGEFRELRACDYGAPTIRKRLFGIFRRDGQPIVWPEPTHAAKPARGSGLKPYLTAADCIDWSLPCPSIFLTPEEAKAFGVKRPLAEPTLRRIAHGVKRYVLETAKPFIARIGQTGGNGSYSNAIETPLTTVTTKAEHLLVAPTLIQAGYGERTGQAPRVPGLDKPLGTVVAGGGKHALVAAFMAKHFGGEPQPGKTSQPLDAPAPTVLASGGPQAIVTSHLAKLRGTSHSADAATPLHTISAQGQHHAEVRALLVKYYGTAESTDLTGPLHTVTTKPRFGLVTVAGEQYEVADIGMRMLQPRELYRAQGFPDTYIIDRGADGRPLPKDAQVRMCGNSVCPPLACAIVAANYSERQALKEAA